MSSPQGRSWPLFSARPAPQTLLSLPRFPSYSAWIHDGDLQLHPSPFLHIIWRNLYSKEKKKKSPISPCSGSAWEGPYKDTRWDPGVSLHLQSGLKTGPHIWHSAALYGLLVHCLHPASHPSHTRPPLHPPILLTPAHPSICWVMLPPMSAHTHLPPFY